MKKILLIILAIIVLAVAGYFIFKKSSMTDTNSQTVFSSQSECEKSTGKTCFIQVCDVVPQGKTYDEVCGKGFKSGWWVAVK